MSDIRVTSRYAKSLLQLSLELNKLEESYRDMELISNTCKSSKDLSLLLKSPVVKPDKKQAILSEIFDQYLSEVTRSFVRLIVRKKRELYLEEIAEQFILQYKAHKNIEIAHVITAIPLTDELRKEIPKLVENAMNSDATIELLEEVDEALIGGIVLRVGDKQLDESIRKKLMKLEMEFSRNPYVKKF